MSRLMFYAVLGLVVVTLSFRALAQKIENAKDMKFINIPNAPACLTAAVEQGDPTNGPSTLMLKGTAGCDAPMHFHSANEQLLMVSGKARVEMKGEQPRALEPAAFAMAPSKHPHHFTCISACQFYLVSDGTFDIHYIDPDGKEISLDRAVQSGKPGKK